ncbi:MAG TPA: hypothetical protein VEF03_04645, partial [Candidatus Binataceae bacterium]|nr:hypothetical protein [Candidatus Binataceae bacterium]
DAAMYLAHISAQNSVAYSPAESRHCWIQVARGSIAINGIALEAGDGASISNERRLDLRAIKDAEVIVFDLA